MYVSQFRNISKNTLDREIFWIEQVIYETVLHVGVVAIIGFILIRSNNNLPIFIQDIV